MIDSYTLLFVVILQAICNLIYLIRFDRLEHYLEEIRKKIKE